MPANSFQKLNSGSGTWLSPSFFKRRSASACVKPFTFMQRSPYNYSSVVTCYI
ncbi:hypothetical protein G134_1745 [Lactobacillus delbrueckii subsp. lactis CRL581]|nr:hypothetical protein G134_1745 [Lactobacillus delbrueckii subsp. lactis CRL581]